jgi:6-pyruvoyltetrahydropterin/6-carboxytetrahydropterin synthase
MKSVLCRRVHFQCVHKYANQHFDENKNRAEFGACFTPHGHGHNYTLDVCVSGTIDPATGMILNLRDLDQLLKKSIQPLDGHHLNLEVPEFANTIPTTENILSYLHARIEPELKVFSVKLERLRLFESEDLWVDMVL